MGSLVHIKTDHVAHKDNQTSLLVQSVKVSVVTLNVCTDLTRRSSAHRQQGLSQKGHVCVPAKHHWFTHSLTPQLSPTQPQTKKKKVPCKIFVASLPLKRKVALLLCTELSTMPFVYESSLQSSLIVHLLLNPSHCLRPRAA